MLNNSTRRTIAAGFVASAALFGTAVSPAAAQTPIFEFPAGQVCTFPLNVEVGDGGPRIDHEFRDADGNIVRVMSTGRGSASTFINADTQATISFPANGANTNTVNHPDGTSTVTMTGHNVLFMFPTDVPAGPSTTLYVGRIVFDVVNATGMYTLKKTSGRAVDICAALS